uniref:Uncharacterized protein n=1 Tax=Aegilops tauschii TaxID=37682 RepID=N1QWF1_AEGTA
MAELRLGVFPVDPRKRRGGTCVGTKAQHCIGRWWRNGEARVAGNLPELAGFGGWWLVEDGEADPAAS